MVTLFEGRGYGHPVQEGEGMVTQSREGIWSRGAGYQVSWPMDHSPQTDKHL